MIQGTPATLVVDIDRGLLRTDLSREVLWAALGRDMRATLTAMRGALGMRQAALAAIAQPRVDLLPICPEVLTQVQAWPGDVLLFSSADHAVVHAMARHLALPGVHLGVLPITRADRHAVEAAALDLCADAPFQLITGPETGAELRQSAQTRLDTACTWSRVSLLRELRPHQWVKNLLLLLPLIAAQMLFTPAVLPVLGAMVAFALGASAIYIVNDLLDLDADRQHPSKRHRPLASGDLPIGVATWASAGLGLAALGTAWAVAPVIAALVVLYMVTSLVYSLVLKSLRWVDLAALVALYCLRVATGAVAGGVAVSPWLAGFAAAVFLALAVTKRLTGLARANHGGRLLGRGYDTHHTRALYLIGLSAVVLAVACFGIYSHADEIAALYTRPWALRLAALPAGFWLVRMVRLAVSGREDFDPLVFVARDLVGLGIAGLGIATYLLAL
ncbi:UbiA family prenyltransferase [Aliiroseovarius subalbicans]|uniref:UbiA family prenyltransferase n=1 Tax=Aliiroseovarius subalbicans TaxID=2925840 RepID=UPI001F5AE123|nr:UbiA family prenyltransferase [Aliiroseovarius subalbicans]MCI2398938.1 UbiA family prenyltransferase [Aliiroseovarius subalbicans]